jgi:hypothetical protein
VLRNFDFGLYRFRILSIERPNHRLQILLNENGYVFLYMIAEYGDCIFIHNTLPNFENIAATYLPITRFSWNSAKGVETIIDFNHKERSKRGLQLESGLGIGVGLGLESKEATEAQNLSVDPNPSPNPSPNHNVEIDGILKYREIIIPVEVHDSHDDTIYIKNFEIGCTEREVEIVVSKFCKDFNIFNCLLLHNVALKRLKEACKPTINSLNLDPDRTDNNFVDPDHIPNASSDLLQNPEL